MADFVVDCFGQAKLVTYNNLNIAPQRLGTTRYAGHGFALPNPSVYLPEATYEPLRS
jgi:hypothetical protein